MVNGERSRQREEKGVTRTSRFGVMTIQNISWISLLERWRYLDVLGLDSAWLADHFTNPWYPDEPWLEGWPLLSALGARTERMRLGILVTNIALHNPAVLAKQAVTVDRISEGRLELGIGAGGAPTDHSMTGVPNWDPPERAARLGEYVELVDRLLRDEVTSYTGRHYRVQDAKMHPAAVQRPRPPLTVAALGPKTLRIAARHADSWNFFPETGLEAREALEQTARRNRLLDEYCAEVGRDPGEITRSLPVHPRMADSPFDSDGALEDFVGRYQEAGMDEFVIYWWREEALERGYDAGIARGCVDRNSLERIATHAIPKLRAATTNT